MGNYLFPSQMAAALRKELVFNMKAGNIGTYVLIYGRRDSDGA